MLAIKNLKFAGKHVLDNITKKDEVNIIIIQRSKEKIMKMWENDELTSNMFLKPFDYNYVGRVINGQIMWVPEIQVRKLEFKNKVHSEEISNAR